MASDSQAGPITTAIMPTVPPAILAPLLLVSPLALGAAADITNRPTFINTRISSPKIALNEVERVEFTTMPRDIENVDIAAAVANALRLGAGSQWRLVGKPVITEQSSAGAASDPGKPAPTVVRERARPVTVVFTLLPRIAGDLALPDVALSWLQGNQVAHFPTVVVDAAIKIGSTSEDLPREVTGVAGFAWNAKFSDLKDHVPADQVETQKDRVLVHPQKNLTLDFIGGTLAAAELNAPGLTLEQARLEFLKHWGLPQIEEAGALTWILGWTRITAKADATGINLELVREDVQANLTHNQVSAEVFGVLDGPPQESAEQAEARRAREAKEALEHLPASTQAAPAK
jgi:hypothetical protein